jgi:L-malate glycosyltransferase
MKKDSDKKLRILIVASPWLGGSGTVAWQLAEGLGAKGHEVHFVTYDNPYGKGNGFSKIRIHNVRPFTYSLFPFPLSEMSLAEKIIEVCVEYTIDIVHAHYGTLFGHASVLAMSYFDSTKRKPKLVITFHGTDVVGNDLSRPGKNITTYLQKTIIKKADAVTVVSENLEGLIRKIYKSSRHIEVIRNGIATDAHVSTENTSKVNQFVHISNFRKVKNIPTIIKAFSRFNKGRPDYTLKLIGAGPELHTIKSLVSRRQMSDRVSFLGVLSKEKIHTTLISSKALLLPSLYESSPLVILEALHAATPTIASRVGGIPEIIKHGREGLLINNPKSVRQLSDTMEILVKSESKYVSMSKRALVKSSSYSIEKILKKYTNLYYRVLNLQKSQLLTRGQTTG